MTADKDVFAEVVQFAKDIAKEGLTKGDFLEQFSCLLFLKMASESASRPLQPVRVIAEEYSWESLIRLDGPELESAYNSTLEHLSSKPGLIGVIFRQTKNWMTKPSQLKSLMTDLIGCENWSAMPAEKRGKIYEFLIEETVRDSKSKAGEHFTPRALISALIECIQVKPSDTVYDPACGTGGFLLEAHRYASRGAAQLSAEERAHLQNKLLTGWDKIERRARFAQMNLLMHQISTLESPPLIEQRDSLLANDGRRWSLVISNPPFGKRMKARDGEISRDDFETTTLSNAANFVQHARTSMETNGRGILIVPDNILFERSFTNLRMSLLRDFDVHTLLRLHPGIWHKPGVKANVLFFDKKPAGEKPWTSQLWVFDFRTNLSFSPKKAPLQRRDLNEFVESYKPSNRTSRTESARFKPYSYEEIVARENANLDIFWLKDESFEDPADLPKPHEIVDEMIEILNGATNELRKIKEVVSPT